MTEKSVCACENDAKDLPRVSVIVPTRDRPAELAELLVTISGQSYTPFEAIIVDDSRDGSAERIFNSFVSRFESVSCTLKYARGSDDLTTARNLGVEISKGDDILFLDDDTLLDQNTLEALATFLRDNVAAIGVQPKIVSSTENLSNEGLTRNLENALYKVLMLTYNSRNKLSVRRSGASIFPDNLTEVVSAQRLSGCCCCYRREVFTKLGLRFDTNLMRSGFMEDLDFSYRVYLKKPTSLYAIPYAEIIHKRSINARLPTKRSVFMTNVYWSYVFFKDVFRSSTINLIAFLWALTGNSIAGLIGLIIKRKPKNEWWRLIYLLDSYAVVLRNLKKIRRARLEFLNNDL